MKKNNLKIFILLAVIVCFVLPDVEANIFKKAKNTVTGAANKVKGAAKKVKDKVEVTGGWDRYIYAWGEFDVPDTERWTAIRTPHKKNKHDMGNFWDVPGGGQEVKGPGKQLQLWEMPYKFQKSPEMDRRYKFNQLWTKTGKVEDMGF